MRAIVRDHMNRRTANPRDNEQVPPRRRAGTRLRNSINKTCPRPNTPAGTVDPFAQNCTLAYQFPVHALRNEWCQREQRLLQQPISSSEAAAAGLRFNEFGISFGLWLVF